MPEDIVVYVPEVDNDGADSKTVLFEPEFSAVSVVEKNGIDLIVPKRGARKSCTINDILAAITGETGPVDDLNAQSTFGDNSRLARKMGVTVRTVREWRKAHPIIDEAMQEEAERDLDWVENIVRAQMMAGDSKVAMFWLTSKGRSRGHGKEIDRYAPPAVSNEALNKKIRELSPRDRLKMLAESHKSGEYEGANGGYHGKME